MALRTLVKIGGITNLSDARYCAGMGVEMLGIGTIAGQPGFIAPSEFQEIRGWIAGPKIVAEIYGLKSSGDLETVISDYRPDYLELSAHELALLSSVPLPFILTVDAEMPAGIDAKPVFVQGNHYIKGYPCPFILRITSSDDLQKIENEPGIAGIAMMGSNEIRPGLKDYDHIANVLEALEVE